MPDMYYTPEQETRLAELLETGVRPALSPEQWNATQFLRENAAISRDSPLWNRFSDSLFLDVPVGSLMLAETLFLATEKVWRIAETARLDTAYTSFTEQGHEALLAKHRRQVAGFEEILRGITPPGTKRWHAPYGTGHAFMPAFRLARGEEHAYVSWCNESYTLPGGTAAARRWQTLVLDRAGTDSLEINHVLFYNPCMNFDICERQKVKRFWT